MRLREFAFTFTALAALAAAPAPQVSFTTNLGSFTVQLNPEAAPATVANFLAYVRAGQYNGTTFHRVIPNFMIQGGGMTVDGAEKPTRAPIQNEARQALAKGLKNVRGSIAMARTSDPNSATAQFFVNVVDNSFLDYPGQDGWGYCVFGQVVKGMEVVDQIKQVKTGGGDNPVKPVVITGAVVVGAKK
jgi:peptidyl-prolyl cis-trans isomerase A (cyclophilin A)/peptidyl-prolyl cis-trans isomerase B (cyclophilin B)